MKTVIGAVFLAATCLFYTNADGQVKETADAWGWGHKVKPTEMDFTVEILNHGLQDLVGVNRHGEITGVMLSGGQERAVFVNKQDQMVMFDCLMFGTSEPSTVPAAINNDGTTASSCGGPFTYVRRKGGTGYQFSVPGASAAWPVAMNDGEDVVGEYFTPFTPTMNSGWYRFHSFLRRAKDGQVTIISAPPHADDLGAPRSLTRTVVVGINNRLKAVGCSSTIFTPSNEDGMWSCFVWSNGQFTTLPSDLIPRAINNDDTILAQKTNGQYVLYDDDKVYTIALPEPYKWNRILGITDKGELFGQVRTGDRPENLRFFKVIASPQ
jgi:hypothetical protein